jgi:Arc/MetJ-type ribon-helix-helix transcriptional regulator
MKAGIVAGMNEMRKITVEVPENDLVEAQALTGKGVTETIRDALRRMRSIRAQQRALELRGKVNFSLTVDEMRYDKR